MYWTQFIKQFNFSRNLALPFCHNLKACIVIFMKLQHHFLTGQLVEEIISSKSQALLMKKSNMLISYMHFILENQNKLGEEEKNQNILLCSLIKTILSALGQKKSNFYKLNYYIDYFQKRCHRQFTLLNRLIEFSRTSTLQKYFEKERQEIPSDQFTSNKNLECVAVISHGHYELFKLSDSVCIGCLQCFHENWKLPAYNQIQSNLLFFTRKQAKDTKILCQALCALANGNRVGFILIGVREKRPNNAFHTVKSLQKQVRILQKTCELLEPKFTKKWQYQLDTVPVYKDPFRMEQLQNTLNSPGCLVRIRVMPETKKIYYVNLPNKIEIFQFRQGRSHQLKESEIYEFLRYSIIRRTVVKNHYGQECKYTLPPQLDNESSSSQDSEDDRDIEKIQKYKNHILIKLTTAKKNNKIEGLDAELTEKNYHFKCFIPFQAEWSTYKKSTVFWLISFFEKKKIMIDNILKLQETYYVVEKNLEIKMVKTEKEYIQGQVEDKLKQKWHDCFSKYQKQAQNEDKKYFIKYYQFDAITISIYAFLSFSYRNIKSTFLNANNFKEKTQNLKKLN